MLYFRDFLLNVFHYQLLYYFFSCLKNNADDDARISPPVFDKMGWTLQQRFLSWQQQYRRQEKIHYGWSFLLHRCLERSFGKRKMKIGTYVPIFFKGYLLELIWHTNVLYLIGTCFNLGTYPKQFWYKSSDLKATVWKVPFHSDSGRREELPKGHIHCSYPPENEQYW